MASTSTLHPLFLHRPKLKSKFLPPKFRIRYPNPTFRFSASASSSSSSDWEREEIRWIREEQRWIREEQRWIREESRWRSEKESLVEEIEKLKLKIESLKRRKTLDAEVAIGERLVIPEKVQVKELIFEEKEVERLVLEDAVKESQVFEEDAVNSKELEGEMMAKKKKRRVLRMGVEGDDVKELQEGLLKLGFYSGEEDMEYSCFSSGTERAVKTWQSSVGKSEDGIMTLELLEKLLDGNAKVDTNKGGDYASTVLKEAMNGAPPRASVSKIAEIKEEMIIKKSSGDTFEESSHKVFLLGENRWEEPSRLNRGDNKVISGIKIPIGVMCLTCRGEGRLMCSECDGSGEPNIEPQFMEWVDEGAKCPYCEGVGFTDCDVCEGNGAVSQI